MCTALSSKPGYFGALMVIYRYQKAFGFPVAWEDGSLKEVCVFSQCCNEKGIDGPEALGY